MSWGQTTCKRMEGSGKTDNQQKAERVCQASSSDAQECGWSKRHGEMQQRSTWEVCGDQVKMEQW